MTATLVKSKRTASPNASSSPQSFLKQEPRNGRSATGLVGQIAFTVEASGVVYAMNAICRNYGFVRPFAYSLLAPAGPNKVCGL